MAADRHYFVINQEGRSAHRKGPFTTAAAARAWAERFYRFPCWIIGAEYAGVVEHRPLNEKGDPVTPEPVPAPQRKA